MTDQTYMGFEGVESRTTEKESEDNSLSSVPIETDEMTTTTQVPSRDWQIGCNLNDCLLNVYTNARWTDITIRFGDKEISRPLKAHKIILAARSPVFDAMFFGPCSESRTEYDFPDDNVEIFDKMLRFVYHDDVNLTDVDEAADLMQMAHMYQITRLVDHCVLFLQNNLTISSVCKSLDCALKYNLTTLCDASCDFIDRNADKVIREDGFLAVSKEGLTYMLKGDTFFAKEEVIFHRVEEWAKLKLSELGKEVNGPNIRDILGEAFYHLRLPTLTAENLMECIKRKGFFSIDEYEDIIDCNMERLSQLSFISNVQRVPVEELVAVVCNDQHLNSIKNVDKIVQTLQITLNRDVCLESIEIPFFQTYIKSNRSMGHNLPNSLIMLLSVVVTIDKINFKQRFNEYQLPNKSTRIVFNDSVLILKKLESPFELTVHVESSCRDSGVMLVSTYGTNQVSNCLAASVSSPTKNACTIGINVITIKNYSFRENKEVSEVK